MGYSDINELAKARESDINGLAKARDLKKLRGAAQDACVNITMLFTHYHIQIGRTAHQYLQNQVFSTNIKPQFYTFFHLKRSFYRQK